MWIILFLIIPGINALSNETSVTECVVQGLYQNVQVGKTFRHPNNKCVICLCCKNGKYTCRERKCEAQPCGVDKQTEWSKDGCCKQCCQECKNATDQCKIPTECSKNNLAYKHDQCCPSCGCKVGVGFKTVTVPEGPYGHVCENCQCQNGKTTCNRPECPTDLLECVNPTFDSACNYVCPNNTSTCRRGEVVIEVGQMISKRNKICMCNPDRFYPRAFCANEEDRLGKGFWSLYLNLCVSFPILPDIDPNPLLQIQGPTTS